MPKIKLVKKCKICGITKKREDFKANGYSKKGTKQYKPECIYCYELMRRNKYKDEIIIVRGKPVAVMSETRRKNIEYSRKYAERNRKEKNRKERERYYNLSELERKEKLRKQKIYNKKYRYLQKLELIKSLRLQNS